MRMCAQCESPTLWCNNDVTVNVEKLLLQDSLDFHRYRLFSTRYWLTVRTSLSNLAFKRCFFLFQISWNLFLEIQC